MSCQISLLAGIAFAVNLIGLVLVAVVSIVLWRRGHKERLIYLIPVLPIALAGTCATFDRLLPCLTGP